jgi:EF-P beta-lysylation protein EpmB
MIPRTDAARQTDNLTEQDIVKITSKPAAAAPDQDATPWQKQLVESRISIGELLKQLNIPPQQRLKILNNQQIPANFPLRATRSYLQRIAPGDINDPLLRQILPLTAELDLTPGFSNDPLNEANYNTLPGLLHKYPGRALLLITKACAIHCRYCFRRHFPYDDNLPSKTDWQPVFDYLAANTSISEVIFSGGDPLAANDQHLTWMSQQIAKLPHIKRLRIHTRLPIVLPSRVDDRLLNWLSNWPGQRIMVIHCNHPNELDDNVKHALAQLHQAGVTLLNQSVLLRGINDDAPTLMALSEKLFAMGVLPYYLHQLDEVQGAAHFAVEQSRALALIEEVSNGLSGFLVPKLVTEVPGKLAKQPLR